MSQLDVLGFAPARRDLSLPHGATISIWGPNRKSPVDFWDFTVNDEPFYAVLNRGQAEPFDLVTYVRSDWAPRHVGDSIDEWLGARAPERPDGRIALYGCPECDSLGCGAVTATLRISENTVQWIDIGMQYDYALDLEPLPTDGGALSLRFDRAAYESTLASQRQLMDELGVGFEDPHEARRRQRHERRETVRQRIIRPFRRQ